MTPPLTTCGDAETSRGSASGMGGEALGNWLERDAVIGRLTFDRGWMVG